MPVREAGYALILLIAATLIVVGVAQIYEAAAFIAAGVLLGLVGYLVLSER